MKSAPILLIAGSLATVTAQQQKPAPDALHQLSDALEKLSHNVSHAVVQIFSTGYAFNDEGDTTTNTALLAKQHSSGSGVILSPDGYIITNNHVVQGARRIQVQLAYSEDENAPGHHSILRRRGALMDAKLIGVDRESDLAVLKIEQTGLPHLILGDSDTLRQGQLVLAFGNPLGLENSVTIGIVSSVGRQLKPDDPMIYIQTDAPINPGNSGGPLLDPDGRVVGINTFIITQSGGSEGIGFSIPSNIVKSVYGQIRNTGHVHRGEIGISAQTITPELARGLGLPRDFGVLLADVYPGGPADTAGLKVGDILLSLNGKRIENARQLEVNLYRQPISEKVTVQVLRDAAEQLTAQVAVIEREDDPQRFADLVNPDENAVPRLGILGVQIDKKIGALVPRIRNHFGVVVAARGANAPYSGDGGLKPGDIIYSVNRVPVASIDALRTTLADIKAGDPAVLQIERDGKLLYLTLNLE